MNTRFEHISHVKFDEDGTLTRESFEEIEALAVQIDAFNPSAFACEIAEVFEEEHANGSSLEYEHLNGGCEPDLVVTADTI